MNMFLSKIDNKNKNYDLLIKERDKTLKDIESFINWIEFYKLYFQMLKKLFAAY